MDPPVFLGRSAPKVGRSVRFCRAQKAVLNQQAAFDKPKLARFEGQCGTAL
ncbi:MAG: hypothetical protein K2Q97_14990 [Burkholderiaceae bacterium]|nr:hypothetical protein [Burkholderiaceae bacterium]